MRMACIMQEGFMKVRGAKWYDFYTRECWDGGQEITVEVCLGRIPVFARSGAIIPVAEAATHAMQDEGNILLLAYAGENGKFTLYEDAGDGYGYEQGEYCLTEIIYDEKCRYVEWNTMGQANFRKGKLDYQIIGGEK